MKLLNKYTKLYLSITVIVFLAGNDSYCQYGEKKIKVGTEIGELAPELKLKDIDGSEISLSSLKGKMVLLYFWAPSCEKCFNDFKYYNNTEYQKNSIYNKYKNVKFKNAKGWAVYTVHLGCDKSNWINKSLKYDLSLFDGNVICEPCKGDGFWRSKVSRDYGFKLGKDPNFYHFGTTFILNGDGIIIAKKIDRESVEKFLIQNILIDSSEIKKREEQEKTKAKIKAAKNEQFKLTAEKYRTLEAKPEITEQTREYLVQANNAAEEKRYNDAINLFEKAIEIDPCLPKAYFNRAMLLGEANRYSEAVDDMEKYLLLVPDAANVRSAQDKIYEWKAKIK